MKEWKQAWKLAMYEVKAHGILTYFLLVVALLVMTLLAREIFTAYVEKGLFILDAVMLIIPMTVAMWVKAKPFQYQRLENNFWASPYFITLYSLAIPKNILMKSRFINYYIWSIPFHILLFFFFYLISPDAREFFTVGEYVAFSVVWMSYGIAAGSLYPASDSGDYVSNLKLTVYGIFSFVGLFFVIGVIRFGTGHGLVYWTMMAAQSAPIFTIIVSMVASMIGAKYWLSYMGRHIDKTDYF